MFTKIVFQIAFVALLISANTHVLGQTIPVPTKVYDSFYIFKELLMPNQVGHPDIAVGVDSQKGSHDWLIDEPGSHWRMDWKGKELWGAVFVSSGQPQVDADSCKNNQRDYLDLSMYNYLLIDMRGGNNSENIVEVGIKDKCDLNNGRETKIAQKVTSDWQTYAFPLSSFKTAETKTIHVLVEFVYHTVAALVDVKNIRYVKGN